MKAYKLLRVRKDGTLGPLFINAKQRIPVGPWLCAEAHRTTGFSYRPGWHCTLKPRAPHIKLREGRAWYEVEIQAFKLLERPLTQGGTWALAKWMRVIGPVPLENTA